MNWCTLPPGSTVEFDMGAEMYEIFAMAVVGDPSSPDSLDVHFLTTDGDSVTYSADEKNSVRVKLGTGE